MQSEATGEIHARETIQRNPDCLQNHVPQILATSPEDIRNPSHVLYSKTAIRTEKCDPCGQDIKFFKQFFRCSVCRVKCHPECKDRVSPDMHSEYKFDMLTAGPLQITANPGEIHTRETIQRNPDCLQNHAPQMLATSPEDMRNCSHVLHSKTAIRTEKCDPCGQDIQFCKQFFWGKVCRVKCHPECKDKVFPDMHSEYEFDMLTAHPLQITAISGEINARKTIQRNPDCRQDHAPQILVTTSGDRRNRSHVLLSNTAIRIEKCAPCGQEIKFCKQYFRCRGCRVTCHPECKDKVSHAMYSEYKCHILLQKTSIRTEKCTACDRNIMFCKQIFKCTDCQVICHLECKEQVTPAMHSDCS